MFDSHEEFNEWFSKDIESHAEKQSGIDESKHFIHIYFGIFLFLVFFWWVLCYTNTVKVIWRLSSFADGGRPQVSLRSLFQA